MLSELISKVSNSWMGNMYFKVIQAMQDLHIHNKHIYSVSALVGWCHLVYSLEHTQQANVTSWYGLLTLCPSLKVYFRSQFRQVFTYFWVQPPFSISCNDNGTSNFLSDQIQIWTKFKDNTCTKNMIADEDRRPSKDNLSVEMGNDDSHFPLWSNTTKGHTF